jgi:hypothetical protein
MLVDPIDNPFDAVFAPWPIRFYILQGGVLRYKAQVCSFSSEGRVTQRLQASRVTTTAWLMRGDAAECGASAPAISPAAQTPGRRSAQHGDSRGEASKPMFCSLLVFF